MLGVRCGELLDPALYSDRTLRVDLAAVEGVFPSSVARDVRRLDAEGVEALLGAMARHHWGADAIDESLRALDAIVSPYGWSVARAVRLVQSMLPGAIHVLDTGNFAVLGEHFLLAGTPQDVSGTPNGRYMGASLGYALGAALVRPDVPVVLWIGDGGLRSMLGELGLAADLGLRLLVLVVRDGHYGSIRGAALSSGLTQTPVNLPARAFGRFAETLGLRSASASDESSLQRVVEDWVADPAPTLCECPTDPDAYIALTSHFR
jgi:acetolactate synthase-1/2/3 large subunit